MPLRTDRIVAAFDKMEFGEATEDTKLAEEWLRKKNINLDDAKEFKLTPKSNMDNKFDSVLDKYNFMQEIVAEVKKNVRLIAELEMLVRGFSYRDAMKSINFFIEALSLYSIPRIAYYLVIPMNSSLRYYGYFSAFYDVFAQNAPLFVDHKLAIILTAIEEIIQVPCEKYKIKMNLYSFDKPFYTKKTPVLVFNGADLDSACEAIVNAAFSEQGLMPWSVNTVLVQEDILAEMTMKLKHRLGQVKIGQSVDKQADFSVPSLLGDYEAKFKQALAAAASKGIEVFQPPNGNMAALFIGGKVFNNSVLQDDEEKELRIPFVNVLAFRGIKEAVALCNNQQQTFAAGVWANDVSLVHEIVHSLNVNTIWVNCHGVFHPSVPIILDKHRDFGITYGVSSDLMKKAETAQTAWAKKTEQERFSILRNIARTAASKVDIKNESVQKLIETLLLVKLNVLQLSSASSVQVYGAHELKQFSQPIGVVYVVDFEYAVAALALGNAAILKLPDNTEASCQKFYDEVATAIPGLFQITYIMPNSAVSACSKKPLFYFKNVWTAIGENYV